MIQCKSCKYYFYDYDTGYSECTKSDNFNDAEYEVYESGKWLENCRHFEEVDDVEF